MVDESPTQEGKLPRFEEAPTRVEATQMLLDLAHQTMIAAPPRTWIQSANHPGSRRWIAAVLSATSKLYGRPLPGFSRDMRRDATLSAIEALVVRTHSTGAWTQASPVQRDGLVLLIESSPAPFPPTVVKIARSGALPFSPQEIARIQRRSQPLS